MTEAIGKLKLPLWIWIAAAFGVGWNIFGVIQLLGSINQTPEALSAKGMTTAQALIYASIPIWMNVGFAIGVFGGLIGSSLLLLRNRFAVPVFLASVVGYVTLFIGDIIHGVFEAFGTQQVLILSTVVAIAAALLWVAGICQKQGYLA